MNLDSVRSLKEDLMSTIMPAFVQTLPMARAYGLPAAPLETVEHNPRAFALGVAPSKKGFKLAIRIQHRAMIESPKIEQIKRRAKGEVDVRYIGRVHVRVAPGNRTRQRPLQIGYSVGHYKITAGTIGAFVRPTQGGGAAILSNNHVLANENRARRCDAILQPGGYDNGKNPEDAIAKLTKFIRLRRAGVNFVDAAIATVNEGVKTDNTTLPGIGALKGVSTEPASEQLEVRKTGRTTGATRGRVTAFELDRVMVDYDMGTLRFDNQLEIDGDTGSFSSGGDSGSLIVNSDNLAVALLFAGSDQGGAHGYGVTYANPIRTVLDALGVSLDIQGA
jgi:hypothetical protein